MWTLSEQRGVLVAALEQATNRLAARARVVVRLEHLELVTLDEVLAGKEDSRHFLLLDESPEALRMNPEDTSRLDQVQVILERA